VQFIVNTEDRVAIGARRLRRKEGRLHELLAGKGRDVPGSASRSAQLDDYLDAGAGEKRGVLMQAPKLLTSSRFMDSQRRMVRDRGKKSLFV